MFNRLKTLLSLAEDGVANKYLKEVNVKGTDSVITVTAYQEMDKSEVLDNMFFEGDMLTPKGQEFLDLYKAFPSNITKVLETIVFMEEEAKIARTALDGTKGEDGVQIEYDFESSKNDLKNRFNYTPWLLIAKELLKNF